MRDDLTTPRQRAVIESSPTMTMGRHHAVKSFSIRIGEHAAEAQRTMFDGGSANAPLRERNFRGARRLTIPRIIRIVSCDGGCHEDRKLEA
jgi:hypothetical protein